VFAQRICALMNHSFTEIDLFILSQGSTDPLKNFPYDFWLPQLEKFVTGDGCPLPAGTTVSCPAAGAGMPADSWKPGGDPGCCEATDNRGNGLSCNVSCAQAECAAAGAKNGESWYWKPENYSEHPYECCNKYVHPPNQPESQPAALCASSTSLSLSSLCPCPCLCLLSLFFVVCILAWRPFDDTTLRTQDCTSGGRYRGSALASSALARFVICERERGDEMNANTTCQLYAPNSASVRGRPLAAAPAAAWPPPAAEAGHEPPRGPT